MSFDGPIRSRDGSRDGLSTFPIDNDKEKVANALLGTQDYLGMFETTVVRVMGEDKAQKALSEIKSFVLKKTELEVERKLKED